MFTRRHILPAGLILIVFGLLLSLGFWQLDRAEEKRQIETSFNFSSKQTPIKFDLGDISKLNEYTHVIFDGKYDSQKQIIYDNQTVNGHAGYYVLTPFKLDHNHAILVNRGFIPWSGKRKNREITVDSDHRTITVQLIKPVKRIQLKEIKLKQNYPLLVQTIDLDEISKNLGYQLLPLLGRLDQNNSDGFYREWKPFYGSVNKHLGYAFQWFAMAIVLMIIAIKIFYNNRN